MVSVPPWQWLTPLLGPAHSREVVEGCDSLVIVKGAHPTLEPAQWVAVPPAPRGMDVSPDGRWVLVASQAEDGAVQSFALDSAAGRLDGPVHTRGLRFPSSVTFLEQEFGEAVE